MLEKDVRFLRQYFERSVDNYPEHLALECLEARLTYQELESMANRLAHYLLAQGITPHHKIALLLERSIYSYVAILAILKTGAAYIPIEVDYPDERINHIIDQVSPNCVIISRLQSQLLASGKVDRKSLPKPVKRVKKSKYSRPKTDLEKTIAAIFSETLKQQRVSIDADFFYDLGGHSLLAAKIVSSLRQVDALKTMSILDLYQHRSIRKLSERFTKTEYTQRQ